MPEIRDFRWPAGRAVIVLALNAGSSSLKFALFASRESRVSLTRAVLERDEGRAPLWALCLTGRDPHGRRFLPDVVGHRLVHGGPRYRAVRIDASRAASWTR